MSLVSQLVEGKCSTPAPIRSGASAGMPIFLAILSAVQKTDAKNIAGQPVRGVLYHLNGFVTICFINLHGQIGTDLMGLQKQHNFFDLLLRVPGSGNHADAFGANTLYLGQPVNILFNDIQGVGAKFFRNPAAITGPIPLIRPLPRYRLIPSTVAGDSSV
jgi:hypothetical protein